jgi:hypothetical protein
VEHLRLSEHYRSIHGLEQHKDDRLTGRHAVGDRWMDPPQLVGLGWEHHPYLVLALVAGHPEEWPACELRDGRAIPNEFS